MSEQLKKAKVECIAHMCSSCVHWASKRSLIVNAVTVSCGKITFGGLADLYEGKLKVDRVAVVGGVSWRPKKNKGGKREGEWCVIYNSGVFLTSPI